VNDPVGKFYSRKRTGTIMQHFACTDLMGEIPIGKLFQTDRDEFRTDPHAVIIDHEDDQWTEIQAGHYQSAMLEAFKRQFEIFSS